MKGGRVDSREFEKTIKALALHAWDNEVKWAEIEAWLENFKGDCSTVEQERAYTLFALTRYMYFCKRLMREMLKSLYRDHFMAPLMQRIRRNYRGIRDIDFLRDRYDEELKATRFIGVGNPSESGTHLLYYFRQVNGLPKDLFTDISTAFSPFHDRRSGLIQYIPKEPVTRFVFFDDLVGSGTQVTEYLAPHIRGMRASNLSLELRFMSLFATSHGLKRLGEPSFFGRNAMCLFELDDSYKAFENESRYFRKGPDGFDLNVMRNIAQTYGGKLLPGAPLGFKNGQLLLAFSHNTPDNAPPIFWDDGSYYPWAPVFRRYSKNYGAV